MGAGKSTTNDKKKKLGSWNPINDILSEHTIESLKNKWERQDLILYQERIKPNVRHGWTRQQFQALFPNLAQDKSHLGQETRRKIFDLFHRFPNRTEQDTLTNQQLLQGLTIITKSDSVEIVSKLLYFVYMDGNKKMSSQCLQKFQKENKNRKKRQIRMSDHKYNGNITMEEFRVIFEDYELKKFEELFQADFILEEKYLIEHMKIVQSFSRQVGSEVFLVQFEWYLHWKDYMRKYHGINPKVKDKQEPISRETQLQKSRIRMLQASSIRESRAKEGPTKRPGVIPNFKLIGDQIDQLKRGLKQFEDYIMVPAWLWYSFETIFRGHPTIKRLYPQIYCLKVYQVFIDETAKFIPNTTQHLQLTYQQMKISEVFNPKYFDNSICMHKCPGMQNWVKTEDFDKTIRQWGVQNCKIFICFVPKKLVSKFITRYNVEVDSNENRTCNDRVKNYATMLDVYIKGVLKKGFVIKISADSVYLEYRNEENSRFQKRFPVSTLQSLNRSPYRLNDPRNLLSHFVDNNKNRSYLHAIIQCMIRTPYFGKYLQKINERLNGDTLVIQNLAIIYTESRKNKDLIDVTKEMNKIESIIKNRYKQINVNRPFQILQKMLLEMEKEFKDNRKQLLQNSEDDEGARNRMIQQFFQTEGTQYFKCPNCDKSRQPSTQDLYGHSLEIPDYDDLEMYFYFFPKYKGPGWKPTKHGFQARKTLMPQEFLAIISQEIKKDTDQFRVYAEIDGRLEYNLMANRENPIIQYLQKGARIMVYEIKSPENLFFEIQNRKTTSRNRKTFFPMSVPILIEVGQDSTWGDVLHEIRDIYDGKFGVQEQSSSRLNSNRSINRSLRNMRSGMQTSRRDNSFIEEQDNMLSNRDPDMLERSILGGSVRKSHVSIGDVNKLQIKTNQFYTVRFIKKQFPQYCFKCKKKFVKTSNALSNHCKGDCFRDSLILWDDQHIRKHLENVCIVVDWDRNQRLSFSGFDHKNAPNVDKLQQKSYQKRLQVGNMVQKNENFKQNYECQNCQTPGYKFIDIQKNPNILIIQVKRFRENGTLKQNKIYYEDTLILKEEQYQLFGVVVPEMSDQSYQKHIYYNYVKCDSYEEWFRCNEYGVKENDTAKEHISENAYILFYKKTNIDTPLLFLNSLI